MPGGRLEKDMTNEQLLSLYRTMQIIRQCEEQLAKSHQRGLIHGACHTYVGQEAIATGVCAHLQGTTWSSARIADTGMRWRKGCRRAS